MKKENLDSTNINKLIKYSKGILSVSLFDSNKQKTSKNKSSTTLFCMSKGTSLSEHTSTKEGLVYVLEGKGTFNLQGREIDMLPGVIIKMEKNAVHSLEAEKNTSFLLFLSS